MSDDDYLNYISSTDLQCWNIVQKGNSQKNITSDTEGFDGGYDKMQKILSKMNTLKIKPDQEDINLKFLRGLPPSWANIAQIMK
nr:ribonuclease H-like domain-containing protein [Tanacetum cinerariifolium]